MRARLSLGILWAGSLGLGFGAGSLSGPGPTRLTFLSVGQGDCAVFQHAGVTVMIDAGPGDEHSDAGRRLIWPKLRAMGVNRIDLVLLSHPDADHVAGLRSLEKILPIGKVAAPLHFRENPDMEL